MIDQQSEFPDRDLQLSTQPNPNDIKLVPYVQMEDYNPSEDNWILSEAFLDSVFDKMIEQGLLKTTFWEENVTDHSHFVNLSKNPNNHVVFFFQGRAVVGFAWLSSLAAG